MKKRPFGFDVAKFSSRLALTGSPIHTVLCVSALVDSHWYILWCHSANFRFLVVHVCWFWCLLVHQDKTWAFAI